METPKGLIIILGLLALGACSDVAVALEGGAGLWIAIVLLVGRIAAIAGILMRSQTGWFLAIGFFVVIIALNAMAAAQGASGLRVLVGLIVPAGCVLYLFTMRDEFDR